MPQQEGSFIAHARALIGENWCFLPDTIPVSSLPPAFHEVECACKNISIDYSMTGVGVRLSLDQKFTRVDLDLLHRIPTLATPHKRCLMNMLSILAHCYRWDRSPPDDDSAALTTLDLPPGLDALWRTCAAQTGQPVVGTNANLKYWNWHLVGRKPASRYHPEDLLRRKVSVNHLWLCGKPNEALENWILTFVLAEAGGASVIKNLIQAIQYAIDEQPAPCQQAMQDLHVSILQFNQLFGRLLKGSRVDAGIWLKQVQHTFAWGIEDAQSGQTLQGPSGMQVGVIQTLNLGLAIPDHSEIARMSEKTRQYYSPDQRKFFDELIAHAPVLAEYAGRNIALSKIYNECVNELARWRVSHQKRGAWYLKSAGAETNRKRISTGLTLPTDVDGTEKFIDMMQQRIDETRSAKKQV